MHIFMTKVISISDEAYKALIKIKANLSFTKAILNLTKERRKEEILSLAGTLSKEEGSKMMKEMKEDRKRKSRRFN